MILAAGLGTRLRPLTFVTPKPLLRIGRTTLIERNLRSLKKAGVRQVVINLHHLGGMIMNKIGNGARYGLKVIYTTEKTILGTGGGIKNAESYLKSGPFFVVNADSFSCIDLRRLAKKHLTSRAAATIVVKRIRQGEKYTRLKIDRKGRLKDFGKGAYMFTGISILEPEIFKFLKKPSCLTAAGFKSLLKNGQTIAVLKYTGYFNDVGTPERYRKVLQKYRRGTSKNPLICHCEEP